MEEQQNPVVYMEMSKLCNYKINTSDIEVTPSFRMFLASRENQMWVDSKKRIWKYFTSRKENNDIYGELHPFLTNYKINNNVDYINLHVYYFICTYVGTQFYLIEILNHAENVLKFMKNEICLKDVENGINENLLRFINLCIAKTEVIICYNELQLEQHALTETTPSPNINIYNPKINIIENQEDDSSSPGDFYIDDDDILKNGTDPVVEKALITLENENGYKFYFIEDDSVPENYEKNVYIATEFSIKSNGIQYAHMRYPNANLYRKNLHTVTFFLMIPERLSTPEEILQTSTCRNNAVYVHLQSKMLYNEITLVLQQLHCHFIVDNIVLEKNNLHVIFNDLKFQQYNGPILDIEIQIVYGSVN